MNAERKQYVVDSTDRQGFVQYRAVIAASNAARAIYHAQMHVPPKSQAARGNWTARTLNR